MLLSFFEKKNVYQMNWEPLATAQSHFLSSIKTVFNVDTAMHIF